MTYKYINIEVERVKSGIKKDALAAYLGVPRQRLWLWQRGEAELPVSKLEAMADLWGVTTDHLLGRD